MGTLVQDIRLALRQLRKQPLFAGIAVATLALGIGANAAIFSMVDATLFRPLPYPAADRLAVLFTARPGEPRLLVSVPDVLDWRARNHTLEDIGVERAESVNLTGTGTPDRLIGSFVDAHTLRILGARTALGRIFTDQETTIGTGQQVAVLSNAVWQSRFGGDSAIIGRTLTLNGRPFVVVGVLSATYQDPQSGVDVYLPITSPPSAGWLTRDDPAVWAVGRLKPGVTTAMAQRDLTAIESQLATTWPTTHAGLTAAVLSLRETIVGDVRSSLLIALAAVAFVLLIACANVANLMLARAAGRRHEISLRTALGATRGRVMRQLLTESLVLAAFGGLAGVFGAAVGLSGLVAAVPNGLPAYGHVGLDARVLAFALVLVAGTGLLFGLAPAVLAARVELGAVLRSRASGGWTASGSGRRIDVRSWFVAVQLALSIVLLIGAGLLARSLIRLADVNPGFDARDVLTAEFRMPSNKYSTTAAQTQFMARVATELRAVPGVESAALVREVPLSGNWNTVSFVPDNQPGLAKDQAPSSQANDVTPDFFRTMRIPVVAGRDFTADDRLGGLPVAIVNEQFARTVWPGQSAIGHRVQALDDPGQWLTVVGVVGNVKLLTLGEPVTRQLYRPLGQQAGIFSSVVARTAGDPDLLADQLRAAIWRVDPDQPVWKVRSLEALVSRDLGPPRFTMWLTMAFAVVALLLAGIGVYGVMSFSVAQRTREVGIRVALGAARHEVIRLVLGRGLKVVLAGLVVGLAAAFGVARVLAHQLFGVSPDDPVTFVLAPAVLVAVALVACWLPARRAGRVDPVVALRSE
jgi:putative ABC transport system permease protein